MIKASINKARKDTALTGVAQWVGCRPTNRGDWCSYQKRKIWIQRQTHWGEDRGRGWGDAPINQGTLRMASHCQKLRGKEGFSFKGLRKSMVLPAPSCRPSGLQNGVKKILNPHPRIYFLIAEREQGWKGGKVSGGEREKQRNINVREKHCSLAPRPMFPGPGMQPTTSWCPGRCSH